MEESENIEKESIKPQSTASGSVSPGDYKLESDLARKGGDKIHKEDADRGMFFSASRKQVAPVSYDSSTIQLLREKTMQRVLVVIFCLAGLLLGWWGRSWYGTSQQWILADLAVGAHGIYVTEVRHPVEVGVAQQQHLVDWLSKRLGRRLVLPMLAHVGFNLVGGRLLPSDNGPAAQFMYEDSSGLRLTLFVRNSPEMENASPFQFEQRRDFNVYYWMDGGYGYALTGKVDKERLLAIASSVYQQTTL